MKFFGVVFLGLGIYVVILYREVSTFKSDPITKTRSNNDDPGRPVVASALRIKAPPSTAERTVDILGRVAKRSIERPMPQNKTSEETGTGIQSKQLPSFPLEPLQPSPQPPVPTGKSSTHDDAKHPETPSRQPSEAEISERFQRYAERQMKEESASDSPKEKGGGNSELKPYYEKMKKGEISEKEIGELRDIIIRQMKEE